MTIQWHITNRCNLRCSHCYQDSYSDENSLSKANIDLVFQRIESLFNDHYRDEGIHLTITGGEPFAFPFFEYILQQIIIRKHWLSYSILTNGTLIPESSKKLLHACRPRYVQISLDGTRKKHDAIRGDGSFDKAIAGVKLLKQWGIAISISFTANSKNYKNFFWLSLLMARYNVKTLWTDRIIPPSPDENRLSMNPQEVKNYIRIIKLAQVVNSFIPFTRTRVGSFRALQFLANSSDHCYHCNAARELFAILPDGTVLPCRRLEVSVGNIFQSTFQEIIKNSSIVKELRDDTNRVDECKGCRYEDTCRGGLKCLAYKKYGKLFRKDPGCYRK